MTFGGLSGVFRWHMAWWFWGRPKAGEPEVLAGSGAYGGTPTYEAPFICARRYPLLGLGRQASTVVRLWSLLSTLLTHANTTIYRPGRKSSLRSMSLTSPGILPRHNLLPNPPSSLRQPCRLTLLCPLLNNNMSLHPSHSHSQFLRLCLRNRQPRWLGLASKLNPE